MGFSSTRKSSSDQLSGSAGAPVQGTELGGHLPKGSSALTRGRGGGLYGGPRATVPGRPGAGAEGLVPAPCTRSAHATRARPQRGRGRSLRSPDTRCPRTSALEPWAWSHDFPGQSRSPRRIFPALLSVTSR